MTSLFIFWLFITLLSFLVLLCGFHSIKKRQPIGISLFLVSFGVTCIIVNPITLALYETKKSNGNLVLIKMENGELRSLKKEEKITPAILPKIYAIVNPYNLCFSDFIRSKTNEGEIIDSVFNINFDVDLDSLTKYHEKVFNKNYEFSYELNRAFEKVTSNRSKNEIINKNEELVHEIIELIENDLFEMYGVKVKSFKLKTNASSHSIDIGCFLTRKKYSNFLS